MPGIETTVTYLEMKDPSELEGHDFEDPRVAIVEVRGCTVSFYRYLYGTVGSGYTWVECTR